MLWDVQGSPVRETAAGLLGFLCHVLDNTRDLRLQHTPTFRFLNHFPIVQTWNSSYHVSIITWPRSDDEKPYNHLNMGTHCHQGHDRPLCETPVRAGRHDPAPTGHSALQAWQMKAKWETIPYLESQCLLITRCCVLSSVSGLFV